MVALVGQSGAGKSSLLHMAGLLEAPPSGEIYINGAGGLAACPMQDRTRIRRDMIGFVYQAHHLLPEFDALENVVMPQMIAGKSRADAAEEAEAPLDRAGVGRAAHPSPRAIVGRRAATRRHRPRAGQQAASILLADEPTGNLDPRTAGGVFDALIAITRAQGAWRP